MKLLVIHPEARAEIDQAIAYYNRQRPGLGLDLEEKANNALGAIQQNPGIGSPFEPTTFRFVVLQRFPFVLYFEELDVFIWVAAFAHARRRPRYWRKRRIQ